jgi:uncharacterized membrane protein (DUF373 family)
LAVALLRLLSCDLPDSRPLRPPVRAIGGSIAVMVRHNAVLSASVSEAVILVVREAVIQPRQSGISQSSVISTRRPLLTYIEKIERAVIYVLLILMAAVVMFSTIDLAWSIIEDVLSPPIFLLEVRELMDLFALFLLVLIGIELLHSVKAYMNHHAFQLETVLNVAIIAVARKIVVLEAHDLPGVSILGIAALLLALVCGYYLIRRGHHNRSDS